MSLMRGEEALGEDPPLWLQKSQKSPAPLFDLAVKRSAAPCYPDHLNHTHKGILE
jgi:hypothetical protein